MSQFARASFGGIERCVAVSALLVALLVVPSARAEMITLQPTKTANVLSDLPTYSLPGRPYLIESRGAPNEGLLQFDVSGISGLVLSATLKIYQYQAVGGAQPAPGVIMPTGPLPGQGEAFSVYGNLAAWQQGTVNWANKPAADAVPAATTILSGSDNWRSWDVSTLVGNWITGKHPNYGITLARSDSTFSDVQFITSLPPPPGGAVSPQAGDIGNVGGSYAPVLTIETSAVNATPEPASLGLASVAVVALMTYHCRTRLKRWPTR